MVQLGHTNFKPDRLLRIQTGEELLGIIVELPNAHLFRVKTVHEELAIIVQFLQEGKVPDGLLEKKI